MRDQKSNCAFNFFANTLPNIPTSKVMRLLEVKALNLPRKHGLTASLKQLKRQ